MKNKLSEALLVLYYMNEEPFLIVLRRLLITQVNLSILVEPYKAEKKFVHYEKQLFEAIERKRIAFVKDAISNLRALYKMHGLDPSATDSGRYHMLYFLLEIEELITTVSSEWPRN